MPRARENAPPADRTLLTDLDVLWRGVNERQEAGTLSGGNEAAFVQAAVNMEFGSGQPQTRDGFLRVVPFNPDMVQSIGNFYAGKTLGAGLYVDTAQREWVLLARHHSGVNPYYRVWQLRDGEFPQYTTPQWETDSYAAAWNPAQERVSFTQCGPEMVLWRQGAEPLHWSGSASDEWEPSSTATVSAELAAYLQPLPAADFGVCVSGRVVFPVGTGEIGWTDIYEPRRWDAALSRYSVGGETGGPVTGLSAWRKSTLVVFKATAVYAVTNFTGDLSGTALERVTDAAGCVAHRTIVEVGGDLIWLGRGGVYRITEVMENTRQLSPQPVSWPIPKSMARVNWHAAQHSHAVLADGLYYLCVPVDGATVPNTVFVLDTRTMDWQGEFRLEAYDDPDWHASVRATLFGRETVMLCGSTKVLARGQGWHDGAGAGGIRSYLKCRGYLLADAGLKSLKHLIADTEEHGTSGVTLSATLDGQRVIQELNTARTRRPEKYLVHGRADRDLSNPDDDAQEPNREDYSWKLIDDPDPGTRIGTGIQLDVMQAHRLKGRLTGVRRYVVPIVEADGGRLRVLAVRAEGTAAQD